MTVRKNHSRAGKRLGLCALGLVALLAAFAPRVEAGSNERLGTAGAPELLIPVGPRGFVLGPTVASDVTGAEAAFWNPAGLAGIQRTEALFTHNEYFADMKVNYAAVAAKAGNLGVLGFSAKVLSVGDVIVTTEQAPDGTGEIASPTFAVLGLSWARSFTDRVNFGLTASYDNEHILNMSATGIAFDFGVQYLTGWRGLVFGMAMKNIGNSMEFNGEDLEISILPPGAEPGSANRVVRFTTAKFEMPSYFTLASKVDVVRQGGNALQLLGAFQNNNFSGDNICAGAELNYHDLAMLRGAWFGTVTNETDPVTGATSTSFNSGDDLYRGFALGGEVAVRTGESKLGVSVGWRPVQNPFKDIYEIGVKLKF